jgi:thiol-disulfide isomerase/thioredoxin
MRRPLLILALTLTGAAIFAQNTTLSGHIIAPTGDSVFLRYNHVVDEKQVSDLIASAAVEPDGSFEMKFKLTEGKGLTFTDGNEYTSIFLMPSDNLNMSLHTAYFDETLAFTGQGAERNNALAGIGMISEMNWNPIYPKMQEPDTLTLFPEIDAITTKLNTVIGDYVKAYPEMAEYLNIRIDNEQKNAVGRKSYMREKIEFESYAAAMVGKPLSDITGTGLKGEKVSLSQFKGKTTVIDFWATWCGPCKAEIPDWAKLEEQYGKDVNFVSISVWDNLEKWKTMATDLKQRHTMFIAKEVIDQIKPYKINSIPRYMVVDKDLKIISIDAPRPSSNKMQELF